MLEAFSKKLNSIISLPPVAENETLIRNLTHQLINEVRLYDELKHDGEAKRIISRCYAHMEKLSRNILMSGAGDMFRFAPADFGYAVGNCVIACDTLLCGSDIVLTFQSRPRLSCVFCYKLITKAVTVMTETLLSESGGSLIEFQCKKIPSATVLLACCDNNNHSVFFNDIAQQDLKLLSRIAGLHCGACVCGSNENGAYIAISVGDGLESNSKAVRIPSYIDLLLDKASDIYIGLSNIDEIHFSD